MFDLGGSAYAIPILSIIYHHRERISLTDAKKKKLGEGFRLEEAS